jgi:hypothetical protein
MDERIQQERVVCGKGGQSEMKEVWEKPKLIILLRGRPEEFVLAGCKGSKFTGGKNNKNKSCMYLICLANCSALGTS